MALALFIFPGDGDPNGDWGVLVIAAMLLAPCVVGRALYFRDRRRDRRTQNGL